MLRLEHISLQAGAFALQDVCLSVAPQEYFVLMGQTGSGKTLLIESVAGLLRTAGGSIFIDGKEVTDLAPRHRHIGYVPQNSGLFPHLTVLGNITFPLQVGGMSRREAAADPHVTEIVESLAVGNLLDRTPIRLSGGERQKSGLGAGAGQKAEGAGARRNRSAHWTDRRAMKFAPCSSASKKSSPSRRCTSVTTYPKPAPSPTAWV